MQADRELKSISQADSMWPCITRKTADYLKCLRPSWSLLFGSLKPYQDHENGAPERAVLYQTDLLLFLSEIHNSGLVDCLRSVERKLDTWLSPELCEKRKSLSWWKITVMRL